MDRALASAATSCAALSLLVVGGDSVRAAETRLLYEVTTETSMPHLEENLRYTRTRREVCLTHQQLAVAFPILKESALQGCSLQNPAREQETVSYSLVCTGGHGTTGQAIWRFGDRPIRGTLHVKLGGKNMTLSQRVTAVLVGMC